MRFKKSLRGESSFLLCLVAAHVATALLLVGCGTDDQGQSLDGDAHGVARAYVRAVLVDRDAAIAAKTSTAAAHSDLDGQIADFATEGKWKMLDEGTLHKPCPEDSLFGAAKEDCVIFKLLGKRRDGNPPRDVTTRKTMRTFLTRVEDEWRVESYDERNSIRVN